MIRLHHGPAILLCIFVLTSSPAVSATQTCRTPTYRFTTPSPPFGTLHNLVVSGNKLVLATDALGYVSEGYIDIPVLPDAVARKNIVVRAELVSSIADGDFESVVSGDILMHLLSSTAARADPVPGVWFSEAKNSGNLPEIVPSGGGMAASVKCRGSLLQFVEIESGQSYRLTYDLDPSNLFPGNAIDPDQQSVTVVLSFFTDDPEDTGPTGPFGVLELRQASEVVTSNTSETIQLSLHEIDDGPMTEVRRRFHTIDTEDHLIYRGGTGEYPDDVIFNYNIDQLGAPLPVIDQNSTKTPHFRNYWDADDVRFLAIEFSPTWPDDPNDSGFALVDNVRLIREDQVEVVLLDALDQRIQSSTLLTGFQVTERPSKIRIYLRSSIPSQTPSVDAVTICEGFRIDLESGPAIIDIAEPRLGFTGYVSPWFDWNDKTLPAIRTEIEDPYTGATENALTCLTAHGIQRWRNAITPLHLDMAYSPSGLAIALSESAPDHTDMDGQVVAMRYRNLVDAGFEILEIIEPDGIIDKAGSFVLPLSGGATTPPAADLPLLHVDFADWVTDLCTAGTPTVFLSPPNVTFPVLENYEISVETNLGTAEAWYWILFPPVPDYASHVEQLNLMAEAANTAAAANGITTGLSVATSVYPTNKACYDLEYFSNLWSLPAYGLDASQYTHLGINTFTNEDCPAEMFSAEIQNLRSLHVDSAWSTKELAIGAYSEKRDIYDPGVGFVNDDWKREYGDPLFGKRVARATLCNLLLPAQDIYYYSLFEEPYGRAAGGLYHVGNWKSDKWTSLFDRVDGTGLLGWDETSWILGFPDPTLYRPNLGGTAFLRIGEFLSAASPHESHLRKYHVTTPQEEYHHGLFQDAAGRWIVALWFFRDYRYAADEFNWLYGAYDEGFVETRAVNLVLPDLGTITSAVLIPLDGGYTEALHIGALASGEMVVSGVPVGEMPVLVLLE